MYLKVQNLSCSRNQQLLFKNLNFELDRGEILHVRGANGSGKSSLLRILAQLLSPTQGTVVWQKQKDLVYIGHQLGIKLELTVSENLKFMRNLANSQEIEIDSILEQLNLNLLKHNFCYQLSAGQRQRVALARLLITKATSWILDEPFTSLDKTNIENLERLMLTHINNAGMIILTSHHNFELSAATIKQLELNHP